MSLQVDADWNSDELAPEAQAKACSLQLGLAGCRLHNLEAGNDALLPVCTVGASIMTSIVVPCS